MKLREVKENLFWKPDFLTICVVWILHLRGATVYNTQISKGEGMYADIQVKLNESYNQIILNLKIRAVLSLIKGNHYVSH